MFLLSKRVFLNCPLFSEEAMWCLLMYVRFGVMLGKERLAEKHLNIVLHWIQKCGSGLCTEGCFFQNMESANGLLRGPKHGF